MTDFNLNDGTIDFNLSNGLYFKLNRGGIDFTLNAENEDIPDCETTFDYTFDFTFGCGSSVLTNAVLYDNGDYVFYDNGDNVVYSI